MKDWLESADAIGAVDAIFAGVGLEHGTRSTRTGSWKDGFRIKHPKSTPATQNSPQSRLSAGIVRVPQWDRWPWLQAGFSTRRGGGSSAYGESEQNLGWT